MTEESRDVLRARELLAAVISRALTPSEVQEAAALIERLTACGNIGAAAWAHTALKRHNKRLKSNSTAARGIEKVGLAQLIKAKHKLEAETRRLEKRKHKAPDATSFREEEKT